MKISRIIQDLGLVVLSGTPDPDLEVTGGYVSDLLSDVMGNAREGQIWMTLQNHKNIVAIASLKDLAAIILVKGLKPDEETLSRSRQEGVLLLGTSEETFTIAGRLFTIITKE